MAQIPNNRMFVGGVAKGATSHEFQEHCESVVKGVVRVDVRSGGPSLPSFAFVEFVDTPTCTDAIARLNMTMFKDLEIKCEYAKPKPTAVSVRQPPRGTRVIVEGLQALEPRIDWRVLKDGMRVLGEVIYANVEPDGTGIAEFRDYNDAVKACQMDGRTFKGVPVRVFMAPVDGRPPADARGAGGAAAGGPRGEYRREFSRGLDRGDSGSRDDHDRSRDAGWGDRGRYGGGGGGDRYAGGAPPSRGDDGFDRRGADRWDGGRGGGADGGVRGDGGDYGRGGRGAAYDGRRDYDRDRVPDRGAPPRDLAPSRGYDGHGDRPDYGRDYRRDRGGAYGADRYGAGAGAGAGVGPGLGPGPGPDPLDRRDPRDGRYGSPSMGPGAGVGAGVGMGGGMGGGGGGGYRGGYDSPSRGRGPSYDGGYDDRGRGGYPPRRGDSPPRGREWPRGAPPSRGRSGSRSRSPPSRGPGPYHGGGGGGAVGFDGPMRGGASAGGDRRVPSRSRSPPRRRY